MREWKIRLSLTALAIGGVFACSSPPPPPPPPHLTLTIATGANQNPGPDGKPAPVSIRLYTLRAPTKFASADYFPLVEREKTTLGEDLGGSEELILPPGTTQTIERDIKPEIKYLGVAAGFREINGATWRASAAIAPSGPTILTLKTTDNNITLTPVKPQ